MKTTPTSHASSRGKPPAHAQPWEDLVLRHKQPAPPARPAAEPLVASYLTHELRAPLASIRSALALLQENLEGRLDPNSRKILGLAVKNTDRLAELINDIMDYSKIKSGKMHLNLQPAAPRALIQEATDSLMPWALSRGVKLLRLLPEEPLPRVHADPQRTVQVLINLISNAIKFTPAGGRVEVAAKMGKHEHAGTIVFSVKDTGPGVPAEDRERIFQRFEQSAATGQKLSQGTGLGLTLSKAMVELQRGKIWVESWHGLGATFRFTVPIDVQDLARPISVYPKRVEYHGLLVELFSRLNSIAAFFSL